jgi:hypothetical protein
MPPVLFDLIIFQVGVSKFLHWTVILPSFLPE